MSLNPIFDTLEHDILDGAHAVAGWFDRKPPATVPDITTTTEEPMSLITDAEAGWNAVEAEYGKFKAALPGVLEKAKAFEASPFAVLAEKAAGTVLPPEAVAIAVGAAEKVLDDLIGLYAPQQAAQPVQA